MVYVYTRIRYRAHVLTGEVPLIRCTHTRIYTSTDTRESKVPAHDESRRRRGTRFILDPLVIYHFFFHVFKALSLFRRDKCSVCSLDFIFPRNETELKVIRFVEEQLQSLQDI